MTHHFPTDGEDYPYAPHGLEPDQRQYGDTTLVFSMWLCGAGLIGLVIYAILVVGGAS